MDGFLVGEDAARRISKVVQRVERIPQTEIIPGVESSGSAITVCVMAGAEDTDADLICSNPVFTGNLQTWDHKAACWSSSDECWLSELGGGDLTNGSRYFGMLVQNDYQAIASDETSIRPLVIVALSGGGGSETITVLTCARLEEV